MEQSVESLSEYQQAFLRKYPHPQLFSVISWGCAATAWLATVLNRHPDIFCVHAANHSWYVLGNCDRLDGATYLRVIGVQGHAHIAAGGVHGMSRHLIPECRRIFGQKFNAAVVVREPMQRLRSQMALYRDFEGMRAWNVDYLAGVIARAQVSLPEDTYENRLFVHAVNMLNAVLEEREVGSIYRCEDLTSSGDALGGFVEEITRGKVSPSGEWLESAVQFQRVNVHAGGGRLDLNEWQAEVMRKVVDPRAWEVYESLGYLRPDFISGSRSRQTNGV